MEKIIREIVDADKQARMRLKEKQIERMNIQKMVLEQSEAIKAKYRDDVNAALAEEKAKLDAQLEVQREEEVAAYQTSLQNLEAKYDAGKEKWVEDIIQRCLAI